MEKKLEFINKSHGIDPTWAEMKIFVKTKDLYCCWCLYICFTSRTIRHLFFRVRTTNISVCFPLSLSHFLCCRVCVCVFLEIRKDFQSSMIELTVMRKAIVVVVFLSIKSMLGEELFSLENNVKRVTRRFSVNWQRKADCQCSNRMSNDWHDSSK